MITTNKPRTITDLKEALSLSAQETTALLETDQIKEAYRCYRNRCLVAKSTKAAELPDWKVVDAFLYELCISREVRSLPNPELGPEWSTQQQQTRIQMGVAMITPALEKVLGERCKGKGAYEVFPHVAMFVLNVCKFLGTSIGERFDYTGHTGADKGEGIGREGKKTAMRFVEMKKEFLRCKMGVTILLFLVARDIGY
jgi:hypothetical protein